MKHNVGEVSVSVIPFLPPSPCSFSKSFEWWSMRTYVEKLSDEVHRFTFPSQILWGFLVDLFFPSFSLTPVNFSPYTLSWSPSSLEQCKLDLSAYYLSARIGILYACLKSHGWSIFELCIFWNYWWKTIAWSIMWKHVSQWQFLGTLPKSAAGSCFCWGILVQDMTVDLMITFKK